MRTLALIALVLSVSLSASESFAEQQVKDEKQELQVITLDGYMDEAALKKQYADLSANGLDLSKKYKWEFRFTGAVMPSLENFAQLAHRFGFWPVALESDINGDTYWLHIQKTDIYDEEKFIYEVSQLFEMADYMKLKAFDGFSVDHPDEHSS
ncbi:ribonuclease E inhibitor RraB [Ningiella sp. W23]|uniref:ribonuclease E inhibitor RraB n=1 Tax=Ningiella sp. W23 TaxID=3023715 RepID=UPI003757F435